MAFSKQTLQSLDSPRLKPLKISSLAGLSANQLKAYLESEQAELSQLQNQIIQEQTTSSQNNHTTTTPVISNKDLSERQRLVKQIQSVRQQKMAAAAQLLKIRKQNLSSLSKSDINRMDRNLKRQAKNIERNAKKAKREAKAAARAAEREAKREARKDKFWEKGIRKGSVSGERAHNRFTRFFESKKWSDSDKDRMRTLMNEIGVYEGDEVFKLLTLMSSGAFDSIEEAEKFLNEYSNTQLGQETNIQKLSEDTRWDSDKVKAGMEALVNEYGMRMTF